MPEKIHMGPALVRRIEEFRQNLVDYAADIQDMGNELAELVEIHRGTWSERSARWQESDRGTSASTWLDEMEDLADRLQTIGGDSATMADDLVDIPTEPEPVE